MENKNYYTIIIALLGAAKLVLDSFGIKLITDQNVNDVANAVATIITFVGVIMTHIKGRPDIKAFLLKIFRKNAIPASQSKVVVQSVPVAKPIEQVQPIKQPTSKEAPAQPVAPTITVAPTTQSTSAPTNNTVQK